MQKNILASIALTQLIGSSLSAYSVLPKELQLPCPPVVIQGTTVYPCQTLCNVQHRLEKFPISVRDIAQAELEQHGQEKKAKSQSNIMHGLPTPRQKNPNDPIDSLKTIVSVPHGHLSSFIKAQMPNVVMTDEDLILTDVIDFSQDPALSLEDCAMIVNLSALNPLARFSGIETLRDYIKHIGYQNKKNWDCEKVDTLTTQTLYALAKQARESQEKQQRMFAQHLATLEKKPE